MNNLVDQQEVAYLKTGLVIICAGMNIPRNESKTIAISSQLHDIGKCTMPDELIQCKDECEGPFTRENCGAYLSVSGVALTGKTIDKTDVGIVFVDIHT